jgi:hypothetical protein
VIIDIPKPSELEDYFVLFFRLKTKCGFTGPNLVLFVKLNGNEKSV